MMKRSIENLGDPVWAWLCRAGFWAALAGLLVTGCAHGPEAQQVEFMRIYTPQVPVFLSGPTAVLLTNSGGFSARVTVRGDSAFPGSEAVEGELLCRGSRLFFGPRETGQESKQLRLGGFSYIWDVATGTGFVLSETLQAYAPVSSTLRVTRLVLGPAGGAWREATAFMNDGAKAVFRVWPSKARQGFPDRIQLLGVPPLALDFSRVLPQPPPANLFVPPAEFSKYPSPQAMADEIAARQLNLRRPPRGSSVPITPIRPEPPSR